MSVRSVLMTAIRGSSRLRSSLAPRSHRYRDLLRGDRGDSLMEFALTLPILVAFLIGLTQMCLAYYTYQLISEYAREGTRYAMVRGANCMTSAGASCTVTASQVNTWVEGLSYPNMGGGTVTAATTYPDGDEVSPHRVQVVVTYTFPYKIPYSASRNLSMTSTSVMYILQ